MSQKPISPRKLLAAIDCLAHSRLTAIPHFVFSDFITSNKTAPASARSRSNHNSASSPTTEIKKDRYKTCLF